MTQATFGTDPEFVLIEEETNRIVSAIPVLRRSKENKIDLKDGAKIYYDNILAEANIDPSNDKNELKARLRDLYQKSRAILKKHRLGAVASHEFAKEFCRSKKAREFGCAPELDIYEGGVSVFPPDNVGNFRSAGGHIHIGGLEEYSFGEKFPLIPLMDLYVGLPSVLLDNDPSSVPRKILYGKAGRFRNTEYGIEYRVLSNFWLSKPELADVIYDLTMQAVSCFQEKQYEQLQMSHIEDVRRIINEGDKRGAAELVAESSLSDNLKQTIFNLSEEPHSENVFQNWL